MMGGNLGGVTAAVSASDGGLSVSTSREAGVSGNFRFGWGLSPYLTLGFESNAWSKSEGGTQKLIFTENNLSAIATENGVGFTGGVGYEMRLGQKWSLGPALDYGYTSVNVPGGSISANYVNFTAAFNWYFQ